MHYIYIYKQQMHNIYIYIDNMLHIVSTATCFNKTASSSDSFIILLC